MNAKQYNQLFSFIWNIANDVLVNVFVKGDYKKIILPMMVLRRLDILLEPTHKAVRKQRDKLIEMKLCEEVQEKNPLSDNGLSLLQHLTLHDEYP